MIKGKIGFSKYSIFYLSSILIIFGCIWGCEKQEKDTISLGYYNPYNVRVDPVNAINSVYITEKGESRDFKSSRLPLKNIYKVDFEVTRKKDYVEPRTPSKISPILLEWLESKNPNDEIEVIITFKEDLETPLLPPLEKGVGRESKEPARFKAIEDLKVKRQRSQSRLLERTREFGKLKLKENFWILNAVVVELRLGEIKRFSESKDIVYLQPVHGNEKPPQDADNTNDVDDGRRLCVSDPYFNLGLTNPWIGLMDTGIRETHTLFSSPSHVAWLRDCVNGGTNCNDSSNPNYNTNDFAWNHGTCSAAIITGNNNLGNTYRGVTEVWLDSWQIYTAGGLNSAAAVRAIQAGISAFDKVLVGEIQANENETGSIATAADNAYDAGVIIVSANGNFGPNASTVRSPAIAHKVLGVGGFMTTNQTQYNNQGRGPAPDGRYKPDIQTPTWSETASNASDNALKVFTGTSGATPYAAAAAMLARNWLYRFGTWDNGQTYAFMILYGQDMYPYNNTSGAGPIEMATNGWAFWGKVSVTDKLNIDIPIGIGAGKKDLDVALWWPESANKSHNDIDVHLIDPSGNERARGYSGSSIFERTGMPGSVQQGTWIIRIRGYRVRTGNQIVYWAAHIRN